MISKRRASQLLLLFCTSLAMLQTTAAFPPIAAEFYGNVSINGQPASIGTNITIYNSEGIVCGTQLTKHAGEFGLLSCNGDDSDTTEDEGGRREEPVYIYVNGTPVRNATWYEGSINSINLSVRGQGAGIAAAPERLEASAPPGLFLLPLIPIMIMLAAYIYVRRKI